MYIYTHRWAPGTQKVPSVTVTVLPKQSVFDRYMNINKVNFISIEFLYDFSIII